jgi:hypothetical protein
VNHAASERAKIEHPGDESAVIVDDVGGGEGRVAEIAADAFGGIEALQGHIGT